MTYKEAIEILRQHNLWMRHDWRKGEGPEMTDPKTLGEAIDVVCDYELTWLDVREIVTIADGVCDKWGTEKMHQEGQEAYYSEVLRIFKEENS